MIYPAGGHLVPFSFTFFSRFTSLCILIHNRIAETRHANFLFSIIIIFSFRCFSLVRAHQLRRKVRPDRFARRAGRHKFNRLGCAPWIRSAGPRLRIDIPEVTASLLGPIRSCKSVTHGRCRGTTPFWETAAQRIIQQNRKARMLVFP